MKTITYAEAGWEDGWLVVPYEIPWRDLDGLAHVNNAVFLTYFEIGRTVYWQQLTGRTGARDISFIVARAECNFRRQLSLAERIRIGVRIGEMRSSSFDFHYEIRTEHGRELAADGKVVVVLFSWEENAKRQISDELRREIESFQKG